ncbi:High-affinity heme uptake system protein IsdE precursor [Sporotomaculum syntrophicum]|uniref:High-affinity heme uptake system protein IsdE n=1 Tax=Sporotomaculum syntrophicum TaxID=182264 RepID=A0A9D3AYC6_9FIRM|nr:ABC transporter substrate-binding protein [Sporotomaculum syntrophicum]KAF1085301.1 High-affinity heme uptake system protein IsdE precursor [Sporotomaculum syntrophicum]
MIKLRRSIIICLTFVIAISLLLTGCQDGTKDSQPDTSGQTGTITVTDCIGRQVEIPDQVDRIACLYAFSGHVVAMLGKADQIVSVVDGLKRDVLLNSLYPGIKEANIPVTSGSINIEELIKAQPDLAFIKGETARSEGEVAKLNKANIPYLVVDFNNMREQQYAVTMIGQAIGAETEARKYNEFYQACIDRVEKKVSSIPSSQRVRVYHSVNEATRTDMKDTLPADWLQAAGVNNVSVNQPLKLIEEKHFASLEQILLWNPDVILVNEYGVGDYIMTNEQWATLSAVQNHRVYQMPIGISRWGHPGSLETPLAILWTAQLLYPDKFTELDLADEAKGFYAEFFNLQLSDEEIDQVLKAQGMRKAKGNK